METNIVFYINGQLCEVEASNTGMMLSDFLRYEKCLTGTKVVCAEGDCGACTILRITPFKSNDEIEQFLPMNSCIIPLVNVHASHILTIESLEKNGILNEVQNSIIRNHGTQCGFCTPGFAMALSGLCEKKLNNNESSITPSEIKNALTGNLCRCTGYNSIVSAGVDIDLAKVESLKKRYHSEKIQKHMKSLATNGLCIEFKNYSYIAPSSLKDALTYLSKKKNVKIMACATDMGVVHNKRVKNFSNLLSLRNIEELYKMKLDGDMLEVGANVSISSFRNKLKGLLSEYSKYLDIFASLQIKNNATLVGNLANASPIGDNAAVLLALDATLVLQSKDDRREVKLADFFLAYKKIDLKESELIVSVKFTVPKDRKLKFFKTSMRKDLDISTLNMAFNCKYNENKISDILIGAGGIAATPIRLKKTERFLKGKLVDQSVIEETISIAKEEFNPLSDVRSSAAYRRVVVGNYLRHFLTQMMEEESE